MTSTRESIGMALAMAETIDQDRTTEPDQQVTTTTDEEIVDIAQEWKDAGRELVFVTAGKAGVGKSTLINNFLGLKGEKAAKAKRSAGSVTTEVKCHKEEVHGITVRIVDTPGLESADLSRMQEQEALAALSIQTGGNADILHVFGWQI